MKQIYASQNSFKYASCNLKKTEIKEFEDGQGRLVAAAALTDLKLMYSSSVGSSHTNEFGDLFTEKFC